MQLKLCTEKGCERCPKNDAVELTIQDRRPFLNKLALGQVVVTVGSRRVNRELEQERMVQPVDGEQEGGIIVLDGNARSRKCGEEDVDEMVCESLWTRSGSEQYLITATYRVSRGVEQQDFVHESKPDTPLPDWLDDCLP